jgi:hypothetical protein
MLKTRRTGALGAANVAEKSLVAGSGIEAGGADKNADDAARLESDSESSSNSVVGAVTVATLPMAVEKDAILRKEVMAEDYASAHNNDSVADGSELTLRFPSWSVLLMISDTSSC